MTQNRFKSPVLWVGILCQIVVILQLTGVITIEQSGTLQKIIETAVNLILQGVSIFAITNNPTNKTGY
jgi:uncharacterized membrane protein